MNLIDTFPSYTRDAIEKYVTLGIQPGDFLTAIICNDLRRAVAHADYMNIGLLPSYVRYFEWEVPSSCWGSKEKMEAWMEQGGSRKGTPLNNPFAR